MRIALFCHSLRSDWNHGNAHFLRGLATELASRGHEVRVYEPENSWSYRNLVDTEGDDYGAEVHAVYPSLDIQTYRNDALHLEQMLDGVSVVLVHEWTESAVMHQITAHHRRHDYLLLFHDTHHRSVTDPSILGIAGFDGVLAFGESVTDRYRKAGWGDRVWTWHEAADTRVFRPIRRDCPAYDVIWIGNWGDGERSAELREFLIEPVRQLQLRAKVHGVRYPQTALDALNDAGIYFAGWAPNFRVPRLFGDASITVHIPRRPYVEHLPGVPTIRVFEALACGIPLICAPWDDLEHLFEPGADYLVARDGREMKELMRFMLANPKRARDLAEHGLSTIRARHTCSHRVDEFLKICGAGETLPIMEEAIAE